ncbi:hypothetical protein K450DRAFT_234472 [Umbelopsis ramanniana AG]|uniref:DUF2421 domain-containing protein n=1 Tax=Umbelopsis ramanniana AG TaxID=1314678 RepID=A0AAD5EDQ3_UMBRA|nr:uncharacterized protein K450DRAFT_234472 [Umbelopsis ramanniana AG]KAI8581066.1 hypothetical protein K450DRAFT_234472 [Umbelopsis ramanniana AG]
MAGSGQNSSADIPQTPPNPSQFQTRTNSILTRSTSSYIASPVPTSRGAMDESRQRQRSDFLEAENGVSHRDIVSTSSKPAANDMAGLVASPENIGDRYFKSLSKFDGYQVVTDDGTLKRRTVSLSTLYDVPTDAESHFSRSSDSFQPISENTPLLKAAAAQHGYNGTNDLYDTTDSDSSDTDSDTPFFPPSKHRGNRSNSRRAHDPYAVTGFIQRLKQRIPTIPKLTHQQKQVLKCSIAYCIGSLFTFIPALNSLVGHNRTSSHIIATTTVFFNPAKTIGGMIEAAGYGWGYVMFALSVCLGSMLTADYYIDRDMETVAHVISLGFWLAGSAFIVAFLKAYWNKPPVSTASSLCFIIIFIILVREGSANEGDFDTLKIQQYTSAVATGTVITLATCFLVWPISAAKKLKNDISATLLSFRLLLKLLTKTFLLDDDLPQFTANKSLQSAIESHRSSFTTLKKSLSDAKLEIFNREMRHNAATYDDIVKSLQRLAQHVGGLRSSCGLQFEKMKNGNIQVPPAPSNQSVDSLLEQGDRSKKPLKRSQTLGRTLSLLSQPKDNDTWNVRAGYSRRKLQDEMKRQKRSKSTMLYDTQNPFEHSMSRSLTAMVQDSLPSSTTIYDDALSRSASSHEGQEGEADGALVDFIRNVRQPMKAFAYTCKRTIINLQAKFTDSASEDGPSFAMMKENLEKAIALFETSQKEAIFRMYQQRSKLQSSSEQQPSDDQISVIEQGEDVFLVYFFIFCLVEFARELTFLVGLVETLFDPALRKKSGFRKWFSDVFSVFKGLKLTDGPSVRRRSSVSFVPNNHNTSNTLHTPLPKTRWRRFFISLWGFFSWFKQQHVRYAIKSSAAAVILATPAFLPSTGERFRELRMEWALVTLMVVMTPTVGGTNLVAIYRIFSTMLGCYVAFAFYTLFPGNVYVLPVLTWLFSIPNFWIILNHKHGKFGQFTLLAYNLVMLNKYNYRDNESVEVGRLALNRFGAVAVGVVFGLFMTAYVWPYEARTELRKGLSDFLLRVSLLYQKLISMYSDSSESVGGLYRLQHLDTHISETQVVAMQEHKNVATKTFMDLELNLQRMLISLQDLLAQTPNEPRLKGPFPVATYSGMLSSCQNILDKLLAMRIVILKDEWFSLVRRDFIHPVNPQRKEMVGNVLLYLYMLASALRLKTPLPPYMPPARQAWEHLMSSLRQLPAVKSRALLDRDEAYIFYFAYVVMMEDVIREMDKVMMLGCYR